MIAKEMNEEVITTATQSEKEPVPSGGKILPIIYWPNQRLVVPAHPFDEFVTSERDIKEADEIIKDMFSTMLHYGGVGLAGPQVGINTKIFVWALEDQYGYMINPVISNPTGEVTIKEQCLSFPGITVKTVRAEKIKIKWQDISGQPYSAEYEGLASVLFQHETEHLEGMTMISTLSATKRDIVTRKMKKFSRMKKRV